jgi:ferrous iron transport protein A
LTDAINLSELPIGLDAEIVTVRVPAVPDSVSADERDILLRLIEIGFVPGERVRVIAVGHPGREPIAVRIGGTTFALRRFEADLVQVQWLAAPQAATVAGAAS